MEPESSLPHSQVPATCPSPYPYNPLSEDPSKYYPPIYACLSQVVSFPQVSPTKTLYTPLICPIRVTCHAHCIMRFHEQITGQRNFA
jgi:hypothetical protein